MYIPVVFPDSNIFSMPSEHQKKNFIIFLVLKKINIKENDSFRIKIPASTRLTATTKYRSKTIWFAFELVQFKILHNSVLKKYFSCFAEKIL